MRLFPFLLLVVLLAISCVKDDTTPPVIILDGEEEMHILVGEAFEEPGYAAYDDEDGDLTSYVAIKGQVDESISKPYVITYKVSDRSGNFATKNRVIIVDPN